MSCDMASVSISRSHHIHIVQRTDRTLDHATNPKMTVTSTYMTHGAETLALENRYGHIVCMVLRQRIAILLDRGRAAALPQEEWWLETSSGTSIIRGAWCMALTVSQEMPPPLSPPIPTGMLSPCNLRTQLPARRPSKCRVMREGEKIASSRRHRAHTAIDSSRTGHQPGYMPAGWPLSTSRPPPPV